MQKLNLQQVWHSFSIGSCDSGCLVLSCHICTLNHCSLLQIWRVSKCKIQFLINMRINFLSGESTTMSSLVLVASSSRLRYVILKRSHRKQLLQQLIHWAKVSFWSMMMNSYSSFQQENLPQQPCTLYIRYLQIIFYHFSSAWLLPHWWHWIIYFDDWQYQELWFFKE